MKIIFTLLFMFFSLFAANIDAFAKKMSFQRDYKTALDMSKQMHKPLVMILSADYCPWCRKFENKTLESSVVSEELKQYFIVVVVDRKYDIKTFPAKYRTQFTPKVFFINPKDESVFLDTTGYIKKKKFLQSLHKALKLYKDM